MTPAQEIITALGGRWHGSYGTARCVAHDDRKPSLKLCDGDSGALLVHCYSGCEPRDILSELRRRNLLDGKPSESDRQRLEDQSRRIREAAERDREHKRQWAIRIWRESKPASRTLVEIYLRHRGLTLPVPPSLRFHCGLEHIERGVIAPAMVAAVQISPGREIIGIHRTYLSGDGHDKAFGSDSKLSLGPIGGGAVRLAAVKPDQWLIVAEGIETTLSAMQASGLPGWAALSTSGLRSLVLPPELRMIVIAADADANGAGEAAARIAAERWLSEGRKVRIATPPLIPGQKKADFNDLILRCGDAAEIKDIPHVA
jgi:putative DNA primase/helicase